MELLDGVLFSAHKDGFLRCWYGFPPSLDVREASSHSPNPAQCLKLTPEVRIVRYTFLHVCLDSLHDRFIVAFGGDGLDRR